MEEDVEEGSIDLSDEIELLTYDDELLSDEVVMEHLSNASVVDSNAKASGESILDILGRLDDDIVIK